MACVTRRSSLPLTFPTMVQAQGDSMPEVDVLMKGLLSQPGVEGFMVFNDAGALSLLAQLPDS